MSNLVACQFAIEDGQVFDGWYNPDNKYWNGWLNPYVTKETLEMILASLFGWHPDDELPEPTDENWSMFELLESEPNVDGLYYIGSGFIWSEVE